MQSRRRLGVECFPERSRARSAHARARDARTYAREPRVPPKARASAIRQTRVGAPTPWPKVRVKPVAPPERWPRASSRPRWPDDAQGPSKEPGNLQQRMLNAGMPRSGVVTRGTLRSEVKEEARRRPPGTRAEKSPPSHRATPRAPRKSKTRRQRQTPAQRIDTRHPNPAPRSAANQRSCKPCVFPRCKPPQRSRTIAPYDARTYNKTGDE